MGENGFFHAEWSNAQPARRLENGMHAHRHSVTDRIGNGIVAGFIATLAMSALHEPVELLTEAVGVHTPVAGWLFHFFVGTLLWGGVFGFVHDYLSGPSWLRGVIFAAGAALIVMLAMRR